MRYKECCSKSISDPDTTSRLDRRLDWGRFPGRTVTVTSHCLRSMWEVPVLQSLESQHTRWGGQCAQQRKVPVFALLLYSVPAEISLGLTPWKTHLGLKLSFYQPPISHVPHQHRALSTGHYISSDKTIFPPVGIHTRMTSVRFETAHVLQQQ